MRKLFIDVSSLLIYARNMQRPSGIQRVTLMFIDEAARILGPAAIHLGFYDKKTKRYLSVSAADFPDTALRDMVQLASAMGFARVTLAQLPSLEKYRRNAFKSWVHRQIRDLNAAIGNEAHFAGRRLTVAKWKDARRQLAQLRRRRPSRAPRPIADMVDPGDRLILMDVNWGGSGFGRSLDAARNRGLTIHAFVHDAIPLETPQFVESTQSFRFGRWLLETTGYVDGYVANSVATGNDLRRFLTLYDKSALEVADVPLAQAGLAETRPLVDRNDADALGLDVTKHPAFQRVIDVPPDVSSLIKTPFVLCVGTVEVRKNPWRVAQAWKRLVGRDLPDTPKLVFAGRKGWLADDFFRFMEATGWLNGWIEFVDSPSDAELEFLYKNCEFTIMASMYEGWGLPIGEGLSYGKTGVVSDVSSMPEVGGAMVEYCDPTSIASIAAACEKLVTDRDHRRMLEDRIADTRLRSWRDVTVDILKAIDIPAIDGDAPGKAAE